VTVAVRVQAHRAFTLIELLVALSLAVALGAVLLSTYALVTTVYRSQAQRALGRLTDDLERTFVVASDTQTLFRLQTPPAITNALWELSFCRTAAAPGATEPPWAVVDRVTYRCVEEQPGRRELVCTSQPLAGPGAWQPPVTNDVITGLEEVVLRCYDGEHWQAQWPAPDHTNAVPRAMRLEVAALRAGHRASAAADVIIPVGNRIAARTKGQPPPAP